MPPTDLFFVVTGARQVFMAKEMETKEIVAVKKIRMDNERDDFPITAIREIKILKKLHHQNIVNLEKVVTLPGEVIKCSGHASRVQRKGKVLFYHCSGTGSWR